MKVSELEGALLDYWVAKAEGTLGAAMIKGSLYHENGMGGYYRFNFRPSTHWLQGGPIIEREEIELGVREHKQFTEDKKTVWVADWYPLTGKQTMDQTQTGKTALIAAMRCFVASKYGESVPNENRT